MEQMIKIWEFANSKKTAIGAFLFAVADLTASFGYLEPAEAIKKIDLNPKLKRAKRVANM